MKQLWAPWRLEYIQGPPEEACFLCAAASGDGDAAALVVARGAHCFVILNRFPYNVGHAMVAPRRHRARLADLDDAELLELMRLTDRAVRAAERELRADGFNIGVNLGRAAGAGLLDHLHVHIVPRWTGDTNFMPVLGDTKVLPEHLQTTRTRLAEAFAVLAADEAP